MSLYDNFVSYHKQIGLWNSPENFKRYGYVLSPEVFTLNAKMQSQLTEIGLTVKAFQEGAKRLAQYSFDKKETGKHTPSMLYRMFREALDGLPFVVSERNVPICKVDLMIDTQGNLKIAEIDAYNPRGIAYAMFLREMHNALGNFDGKKLMPGVFPSLENIFEGGKKSLVWVYAERERYYEPVMTHMAELMQSLYGLPMQVISSSDSGALNKLPESSVFLIIPWGMTWSGEFSTKSSLVDTYQKSPEKFFYPLMPWLGTKGILGAVSCPVHNSLDALISDNFEQLELIRKYVPETLLISQGLNGAFTDFTSRNPETVLKANVASGMKGVWMEQSSFEEKLQKGFKQKTPALTLQQKVDQQKFSFEYFKQNGEVSEAEWYLRLIAYVDANGKVVDAEVTGRPTPDVHGAPDCIQLPCVLG